MKTRPAAVIFILVTVTLDILAMGLIIPVLPKLFLDFLGGEMTDAAKWSARFAVVFALMQFFCSPLLGVLSDRFGRRPIILLSNLGFGLQPPLVWRIGSGVTSLFRNPWRKISEKNSSYGVRTRSAHLRYCVLITNFGD